MKHLFKTNNWKKFVMIHDGSSPWDQYLEAVQASISGTDIQMVNSYQINTTISDRELQQILNEVKKQAWSK